MDLNLIECFYAVAKAGSLSIVATRNRVAVAVVYHNYESQLNKTIAEPC